MRPRKPAKTARKRPARGAARAARGRRPQLPGAAPAKTGTGELPWREIERRALDGGAADEIVKALRITAATLELPTVKERFEAVVEEGHARMRLELRRKIRRRGSRRGSGSPNMLALQARNWLSYDRNAPDSDAPLPIEIAGAADRLLEAVKAHQRSRLEASEKGPRP
jgi:hypothetical protein